MKGLVPGCLKFGFSIEFKHREPVSRQQHDFDSARSIEEIPYTLLRCHSEKIKSGVAAEIVAIAW
jgi:hypothetical protein